MTRTTRSAIGLGVLAAVAASTLLGCSPPDRTTTAVILGNGHPTALFEPCHGTHVVEVAVMDRSAQTFWASADPGGHNPANRVRLLESPPKWVVQNSTLTVFDPQASYWVVATTDRPEAGRDQGVDFTLGDLSALKDGEVWALGDDKKPKAMSTKDFQQRAADSC